MKSKSDDFQIEIEKQHSILIKAENKEQHHRAIIIITILSLTLLSTIIGTFFAYKAYKLSESITKKEIATNKTTYQTLVTTYIDSPNIQIGELITGYEGNQKEIKISNEGNTKITYSIKLTSITTNLLSTNNLVYSLIGDNNTNITKELPLQESLILDEITLNPNETTTYKFNIKYNGALERYDIKYNYQATFLIEEIDNKTNLLE